MYPSNELPQYCAFLHNQVKAMQKCGEEISVIVPSIEKETEHIVFDGVDVFYIKYREFSRSILAPFVYIQLKKGVKRFLNIRDFDVVYAIHAPVNVLYSAMKFAKSNKLPFIVHYRGYNIFSEFEENKKAFLDNREKVMERIIKNSDLSLAVSKKTASVITDRFPELPVEVVYNGVDKKMFDCQTQVKPHEGIKILCVANLIPIKGHKYLFDAFKKLTDEYPDKKLQLDIVGRGYYEDHLKEYLQTNNIKNIIFHGYVSHEGVSDYMKNTDIFVLPSVYEAFANVCLEAMACKKPIVIFRGQGTDEILDDGVNGLIAEKANAQQLKEKIEFLLLNPEKRKKIAENGYNTVKEFTWQSSGENIIKKIKKVIKRHAD